MDLRKRGVPKFATRQQAPVWYLLVVTVAIVGFFVASTVYSQRMAARLDEDAASIAINASPSIEALSAARGDVLRAEVAVARAIEAAPGADASERAATEDALRQMRAHQTKYLRLPFYPGERANWEEVDAATRAFQREISICFAALEKGRLEEARAILTTKLRPATERLDNGLAYLVDFHAAQQHRMGFEIQKVRRRAARIAYVLDAVSAALAIVLIALVLREARRRQRLLAHFGERLGEMVGATGHITAAVGHDDVTQPVLNAIVQEACRLVDAEYAALGFLVDGDRPFDAFVFHGFSAAEVKTLGRFPRPVGVLGEVITEGRPLRIDDVTRHPKFRGLPNGHPPMGAFLGVPVRRDGRGAGNLYVARRPGRPAFTEEDEHIIQLLAAQAAISTENARLYRELKEQRVRAQLLADASSHLVDSLDYEHRLEQAASAVLPGFGDICVLHVTDDSGKLARTVMATRDPALRELASDLPQRYGPLSERHPAVRASRELRPIRFPVDSQTLDHLGHDDKHRSLLRGVPIKHGLAVPIVGRTRLLGVMSFLTLGDSGFNDQDIAFAEEVARRTALSIDNALLHLRTERAVQARNDVLAIVSHDLRSPLSSLRMAASLLKRAPAADEKKRHELADRIARTTDGMTRLIEDLLAASKIESGSFSVEPKPEPLETLITEAVELLRDTAATKSISLHAQIEDALAIVTCDRERILQVLANLIGNAIKFTPAEGVITVSTHSLGEEIRVCVSDTGSGIPEADREHVFDRYWQASHTRRAGAGLGLFIVKGIVEAHGGHSWAEAREGGGACLCFTLPAPPSTRREVPVERPCH